MIVKCGNIDKKTNYNDKRTNLLIDVNKFMNPDDAIPRGCGIIQK